MCSVVVRDVWCCVVLLCVTRGVVRRHLLAFHRDSADPFLRLYLLPDRSRAGRRKTSVMKRTLDPVYDQTYDYTLLHTIHNSTHCYTQPTTHFYTLLHTTLI